MNEISSDVTLGQINRWSIRTKVRVGVMFSMCSLHESIDETGPVFLQLMFLWFDTHGNVTNVLHHLLFVSSGCLL